MKKLFSVVLLTPIFCFSQANLLNTKSSFEIEKISKKVDEDAKPLDYEYVSDDDILFSFTTWEVIDLNQRVNFPLYYPTEINSVSSDRKPLIHYLLQAIQDPLIGAKAYSDENFINELEEEDVDRIRVYKRLKIGVDNDNITEGREHFEFEGSTKTYLESLGYEFPEDEDWVNYDPISDEFLELQFNNDERVTEFQKKWDDAAAEVMSDKDFEYAQFDYGDVRKYLLKGIWYFDKKNTQLKYRPIAIGPVAITAEEKFEMTLFNNSQDKSNENPDGNSNEDSDSENPDENPDGNSNEDSDSENPDENPDENSDEGSDSENSDENSNDISDSLKVDEEKEYQAMFWVFFPEVRDLLHRSYAFNDKNMSKPISFDHIINSRRFSATIYKEANVYQDRDIRKYIGKNSLMQLLESERIKEKIRNLEQDMWSY